MTMLPAWAGSLQVSPISLEFAADEQAQGIWLSNSGTEPIRAQVRVQQWTQTAAGDALESTNALVASPPMLEIAAGQRQLVRIVRLSAPASAQETAYRLLVDELPASEEPGSPGLQFLLRYSVPVFLLPTSAVPAARQTGSRPPTDLSHLLGTQAVDDGNLVIVLQNQGVQRLRISQLTHAADDGTRTPLMPGLLGYVLAGREMRWTLPLPAAVKAGGVLKAKFNDDPEEQTLPLYGAGR